MDDLEKTVKHKQHKTQVGLFAFISSSSCHEFQQNMQEMPNTALMIFGPLTKLC